MKIAKIAAAVGSAAVQLLFPRRCPVCDGIVTPFGEKICLGCMKKLRYIAPPRCLRCGKRLEDAGAEYCRDCGRKTHYFVRGRALYEYESVAASIYRFKYGGRREYADFFGEELAECLGDFLREVRPDALIPVPVHKSRLRKRGFNQSELLAKALGRRAGIPVRTDCIRRVKKTVPLKLLNPEERQNNLKKAFHIAGNDVKLREMPARVMIVDDIYTTGSTIDEMARVLLEAGVREVYFVTLACGRGI